VNSVHRTSWVIDDHKIVVVIYFSSSEIVCLCYQFIDKLASVCIVVDMG